MEVFVIAILGMVLVVVVFILLRQLALWYFRINEAITNQQTQIALLQQLVEKLSNKQP